jgi:hypothetical protein
MTHIAEHLCAVMALIAAVTLALSFQPAMAEQGNVQVTMKVLASANAKVHADLMELQQLKVAVPFGAEAYYSAAVKEQELAKAALESGNPDFAKNHIMNAMNLFKTASDMLASVQELEKPTVTAADENQVAIQEDRAGYLQTLTIANNVSASFADYDSAIQSSKAAIVRQDLRAAEEHLDRAESVLDDIQGKLQVSGDSNKEERVEAFAEEMKAHLLQIVSKAEKDTTMTGRKTLMLEAINTIQLLENAADVEEIIKITEDSSRIQDILNEYSAVISDLETVEDVEETGAPTDEGGDETNDTTNGETGDEPNDSPAGDVPGNNETENPPPSEPSEAEQLTNTADELEQRANELLDESGNVVATLKINEALALIATARIDIDAGNYDLAAIALSSAEVLLDLAEELIR